MTIGRYTDCHCYARLGIDCPRTDAGLVSRCDRREEKRIEYRVMTCPLVLDGRFHGSKIGSFAAFCETWSPVTDGSRRGGLSSVYRFVGSQSIAFCSFGASSSFVGAWSRRSRI